jgi:hypothetical protein
VRYTTVHPYTFGMSLSFSHAASTKYHPVFPVPSLPPLLPRVSPTSAETTKRLKLSNSIGRVHPYVPDCPVLSIASPSNPSKAVNLEQTFTPLKCRQQFTPSQRSNCIPGSTTPSEDIFGEISVSFCKLSVLQMGEASANSKMESRGDSISNSFRSLSYVDYKLKRQ